jgi:hypothetical protein
MRHESSLRGAFFSPQPCEAQLGRMMTGRPEQCIFARKWIVPL